MTTSGNHDADHTPGPDERATTHRHGRVDVLNPRDHEVAVAFAPHDDGQWFHRDELRCVARPQGAPAIRTHAERTEMPRNAQNATQRTAPT